jgi:hypothetical protein
MRNNRKVPKHLFRPAFLSMFFALARYRVVKITHSSSEVVL